MKSLLLFFVIFIIRIASVQANPYDFFNSDPFSKSLAGANSTVNPTLWSASASNPAVLSETSNIHIGFSYSYANLGLSVNGKNANLLDYKGFDVGFDIPLNKFLKYPFYLGATLHMPDQFVARIQSIPASEPRFIFYDNDPHRMIITLGLAFKPLSWLSFGLGSNIFLDLQGDNLHIFIGSQAGEKIGKMGIETSLPIHSIPTAGLNLKGTFLPKPFNTLKLGIFYREAYVLKANLNIVADVNIANVVTGDTLIFLKMQDHYSPRKLSFGLNWSIPDILDVYADVSWYNWAKFSKGQAVVKLLLDFGINPPMIDVVLPDNNFQNTITTSIGAVIHADQVLLSMGYKYQPSPVPEQNGFATLMDNNVHILGMGLSAPISLKTNSIPFLGELLLISHCKRVFFSYQYQHFQERKTNKINPTLENIFYGGQIHQISFGAEYKF